LVLLNCTLRGGKGEKERDRKREKKRERERDSTAPSYLKNWEKGIGKGDRDTQKGVGNGEGLRIGRGGSGGIDNYTYNINRN